LSLEELLRQAPTETGIYRHRLRNQWITLQQHPELMAAMQRIVANRDGARIDPIAAYQLESMGIARFEGNQVLPGCELYRLYFLSQVN
jgi:hypothetical protein